jgi:putative tryptophan/tyrosine transport system substrate-binding protein
MDRGLIGCFKTEFKSALKSGITLCTMLFALSFPVEAQQTKKVYRIGYLSHSPGIGPNEEAFRQGLRDLGYIEGQNLVIEWRFAKGKLDRHPELAAELVRLKVDCIITIGVTPTRVAKQATSTIPIVMGNASDDPVRHGLVASLARPGGNVTGFTDISQDLAGKRLELLKEAVPKAARIAILWHAGNPVATTQFKETKMATRLMGVQLQSLEVRGPDDFENAFRAAGKGRAEALIVVSFGFVINHKEQIINFTVKNRLPVMYTVPDFVHAGGLMSYAPDGPDRLRRAATYVDKILKGTEPADLPVQQPMKFELIINLKAAKQIGLTIPQSVLYRADKVIR